MKSLEEKRNQKCIKEIHIDFLPLRSKDNQEKSFTTKENKKQLVGKIV